MAFSNSSSILLIDDDDIIIILIKKAVEFRRTAVDTENKNKSQSLIIFVLMRAARMLTIFSLFFFSAYPRPPPDFFESQLWKSKREELALTVTHKVFFDIKIGDESAGRISFGLFGDEAPLTVKNFFELSRHKKYKGNKFHRIIPNNVAQAGDITKGDGRGGASIYDGPFNDEPFIVPHDKEGLLSMANVGPDTNLSQFMISLVPTPWLDGRHVVFGQVLQGMPVLREIEKVGQFTGVPLANVVISDCGTLDAFGDVLDEVIEEELVISGKRSEM